MNEARGVGFVGLGVMGGPMASHLLNAGVPLSVWSRTAVKAQILKDKGAHVCESLDEMASRCNVIILCVTKSEDVQEIISKLAHNLKPGSVIIDHSTIAPPVAAMIYDQLSPDGISFVDAPVTGGSMGAINGTLTVFCGGEKTVIEDVTPLLLHYSKRVEMVGGPGQGQMMKMVNQIAVGGALLGLCEALSFAKKAGLDVQQAKDMVGSGAAGSWAFDNYGPKILAEDWSPGFSINNQLKDLIYCEEAAEQIDAFVPGTSLVRELLQKMKDEGQGDLTTAALFMSMLEKSAATGKSD